MGKLVMEHYWTALFCTIHLSVGFLAGRFFREPSPQRSAIPPGFGPAVARFEAAFQRVQPSLVQLPDDFQQALECLKNSVLSLAEKINETPASTTPNSACQTEATTTSADDARKPASPANSRKDTRHGHAVPEFMALWDGEISSIQAFNIVQCHDLSASGISFFFDRTLDVGEQLVITLGQQNGGVLMAAQVVYSRPIIVRGEDLYRIGCKFVRRLDAGEVAMLDPLLATVRTVYSITR